MFPSGVYSTCHTRLGYCKRTRHDINFKQKLVDSLSKSACSITRLKLENVFLVFVIPVFCISCDHYYSLHNSDFLRVYSMHINHAQLLQFVSAKLDKFYGFYPTFSFRFVWCSTM